MKSIWYCSSLQDKKFINNTRSRFSNTFDIDDIKSIPDGEIEVAIKHIFFDEENIEENSNVTLIKKRQRVYGDKVLGIRSNICEASIVNCGYEKELCHFKVEKVHHFEFINPSFFKTTKDLLANATFSIIDVKSEEQPNWKIGAPTYIQAIVRSAMVESFSIYLDSDDEKSVNKKTNTNMNFTIDLPQRLYLEGWEVCLKSIIIPCRVWNIYPDYKVRWTVNEYVGKKFVLSEFGVPEGSYGIDDITHLLNEKLKGVKIVFEEKINRIKIEKPGKLELTDTRSISFSPYLAKILGFTKDVRKENIKILMYNNWETTARYPVNVNFLSPKTIIVNSDIVEDTIFGGERVKLLKVIPNKMERNGDVVQYEFIQDEFVKLGTSEFNRINISICDVSGDNLNVDYDVIPTRLQLEFRKPRSLKEVMHME